MQRKMSPCFVMFEETQDESQILHLHGETHVDWSRSVTPQRTSEQVVHAVAYFTHLKRDGSYLCEGITKNFR